MKKSKNNKIKNLKRKKVIKVVVILLVTVLIIELSYLLYMYCKNEENTTYYTLVNNIVNKDNGYVGVGTSDMKHSKYNKKSDYSKALVYFYNDDMKQTGEKSLKIGYHSFYNDIAKDSSDFIAVGAVEMSKEQMDNNCTEGLIVKYDKDFNISWRKNIKILNDTEFTKVKILSNGDFIVVGQSIYDSGRIGNHTTGGAIIMKFDSDGNEIFGANYSGPYSGIFTDVLVLDDGYVVSGCISKNVGVVVKYDLSGNKKWDYHYSYTDEAGFTSINKIKGNYVLTGSKLDSKGKYDYYRAAIVVIDKNGKKVNSYLYKSDNITRFTDLILDDNIMLVSGTTGKRIDDKIKYDGLIVKYNMDFKDIKNELFAYNNNDSYNKFVKTDNDYYVIGYTNSKVKLYKSNGKDYYPVIKKIK